MAVSVIGFGLSAVNASGNLPENPEDRTITQELEHAIAQGDSTRTKELGDFLTLMSKVQAELNAAASEFRAIDAEMQSYTVNFRGSANNQPLALVNFGKYADKLESIIPECLALKGGALPPSDSEVDRVLGKLDSFLTSVEGFNDRLTTLLDSPEEINGSCKPKERVEHFVDVKPSGPHCFTGSDSSSMVSFDRARKACRNPGVPNDMITAFLNEFNQLLADNNLSSESVSNDQIATHLNNYLGTGRL